MLFGELVYSFLFFCVWVEIVFDLIIGIIREILVVSVLICVCLESIYNIINLLRYVK